MKMVNKINFPEYNTKSFDFKKDKFTITQRILDMGTLAQIKKLLKIYDLTWVKRFVKVYGARKLSFRSLNFWLKVLKIEKGNRLLKNRLKNPVWKF